MTRENFLILLGILVIISPFAGIPLEWLSWALPAIGALIILTSLIARHARRAAEFVQEDV